MDADFLKSQVELSNKILFAGMKAGQEIERQTSASLVAKIEELERDCMTLALRLYGEDDNTFAPETREVMARWRPRAEALLQGKP